MGSTSSKKPNDPWNRNETNFKLLSKKLKLPSKPKKLRFFDSPSKCLSPNKTSNDDWLRKKKKSITPDETVSELLNPCRPNSTSPTNDPTFFTPRTLLLSTKSENWRPNFNKPRVKSKNPSPNAETLKTKPRKPSPM